MRWLYLLVLALCLGAGAWARARPPHASGSTVPSDWLAVLPGCALPSALPGSFVVHYPRNGLPSLLGAGAVLVARVQLPLALTPPPGVQQPRALRGFAAALLGRVHDLSGGQRVLRYPLRVERVRPDAAWSLVYRVSLRIPAWLAPGTYDLQLLAPGGQATARAAVRVLSQAQHARIARLGRSEDWPRTRALPIDAWFVPRVAGAAPGGPGLSPLLALDQRAVALRMGADRLLSLGGCSGDPVDFAHQVAALAAQEGRSIVHLESSAARPGPSLTAAGGRELLAPKAVEVQASADRLVMRVAPGAAQPAELAVFVAGAYDVRGAADARWYPAAPFAGSRTPPGAVVRLRVAPGARALLQARAPGRPEPVRMLQVEPEQPHSGQRLRVSVPGGVPAGARVAWELGEGGERLSGGTVELALARPGAHALSALWMAKDGRLRLARTELVVRPARATGCALSPLARQSGGLGLLLAGAILLRRRRRGLAKKAPVRFGKKGAAGFGRE